MLNTEKLLYILPDLTYLAELLPGKKDHAFTIQSFRQINGEFLDDNEFISNNIQKLFTKIDKEDYHLILPDFLFTNAIVSVDDDTESDAIKHVKEKLLPDLNLSEKTHEIEITVLTSFKGKSKVQISAIEKELLSPIRVAAKASETNIKAISPLSWAIKSIVSLEPSITILQIGNNLYSAQHYIGVDQTSNFPTDEFESIGETIKTLKGAEPSIQTIYLASNSLVEENLKKDLGTTLPIQQLATYKENDSKMPSYVRYIIESCMKTLSISDFPVPKFKLGKASKDEGTKLASAKKSENKKSVKKETAKEPAQEKSNSKNSAPTDLPEPSKVPEAIVLAKIEEAPTMSKDKKAKEEVKNVSATIEEPTIEEIEEVKKASGSVTEEPKVEAKKDDKPEPKEEIKVEAKEETKTEVKSEAKEQPAKEETKEEPVKEEINLTQFAGKENESDEPATDTSSEIKTDLSNKEPANLKTEPQIIKNKVIKNSSGVNNMLKMVFITLAVFFITIAIGIGVGLGLLKMSDKKSEEISPVVVVEPEATPEATATPDPVEEIDKEGISILVVNATTKAGYAGKIKTLLIDGEINDTKAGNAEGDYVEEVDYILMIEENEALKKLLEETTELEFEYSSDVETEDPDGDYDAVIVLAK